MLGTRWCSQEVVRKKGDSVKYLIAVLLIAFVAVILYLAFRETDADRKTRIEIEERRRAL